MVTEAVKRDLAEIARRDKELAKCGLAMVALALAGEIDNAHNSATSKSMCARALVDALVRLREMMPEEETKDGLDELSGRRKNRIAGRA